jgi:hypothetical protein
VQSIARHACHTWASVRVRVRTGIAWTLAICVGLLAPASVRATPAPSDGYFHVETRGGRWWLVAPDGSLTLSIGVDDVSYEGDRVLGAGPSPYPDHAASRTQSVAAWSRTSLGRLREWGFNTLGAWSDESLWDLAMPYTIILDLGVRSGADWARGTPVDVYDPAFPQIAREIAEQVCAPHVGDHQLIGYFSDNELWWGPDWRHGGTVLGAYLALAPDAPGRQRAIEFLRQRYGNDIRRLDRAWAVTAPDFAHLPGAAATRAYQTDADRFLEMVASRYFTVSRDAIHAADPHHLYLGARFAGQPPDAVLRATRVVDVVSINLYDRDPRSAVRHVFAVTGRPVLVTEFSFRALDSGLPNTRGAGPWVLNQRTRGWAYADYVARLVSLPETVGYHWFRWADEPKEGRFPDGENSNYGLVRIDGVPYAGFVAAVAAANRGAVEAHRDAQSPGPIGAGLWWRLWSLRDLVAALVAAPRWISTAIGTVRAMLSRGPLIAYR